MTLRPLAILSLLALAACSRQPKPPVVTFDAAPSSHITYTLPPPEEMHALSDYLARDHCSIGDPPNGYVIKSDPVWVWKWCDPKWEAVSSRVIPIPNAGDDPHTLPVQRHVQPWKRKPVERPTPGDASGVMVEHGSTEIPFPHEGDPCRGAVAITGTAGNWSCVGGRWHRNDFPSGTTGTIRSAQLNPPPGNRGVLTVSDQHPEPYTLTLPPVMPVDGLHAVRFFNHGAMELVDDKYQVVERYPAGKAINGQCPVCGTMAPKYSPDTTECFKRQGGTACLEDLQPKLIRCSRCNAAFWQNTEPTK